MKYLSSTFQRHLVKALVLAALMGAVGCQQVDAQRVKVAVFSLNDFHGSLVGDKNKNVPGAACVLATLDSLKRVYPYHLTVSAGDNFGGSYFYKATKGTLMPRFFADCGIRVSAVGNHEFDDGVEELAKRWYDSPLRPADWSLTYVCANVRDREGRQPEYMQPFAVEEIRLSPTKKIKVAFVGLLTSSTPLQVSKQRIEGLTFDGRYDTVLDSVAQLKEYEAVKQADLRMLLMHVGTQMNDSTPVWDDPNAAEIGRFHDASFHAMLTGHTHSLVCGHINEKGYAVVQGKWRGEYISMIEAEIDTTTMEVLSVKPVLVPTRTDLPLRGKSEVMANLVAQQLKNTTIGDASLSEVLTYARQNLIHDREDKYKQTEVGRLVCEAYDMAARHALRLSDEAMVVGTSHFGSIRTGFTAGEVRVLDVGESLPFANSLRVFRLSGKELHRLVEFGMNNQKYGFIQTSRLSFERGQDGKIGDIYYTSPQGKQQSITPTSEIYLCVDDFQANGGDGYSPSFFPREKEVKPLSLPTTTEALLTYLRQLKEIG